MMSASLRKRAISLAYSSGSSLSARFNRSSRATAASERCAFAEGDWRSYLRIVASEPGLAVPPVGWAKRSVPTINVRVGTLRFAHPTNCMSFRFSGHDACIAKPPLHPGNANGLA